MKKIAAVLALSFAAMGAQAAPVIIDIAWLETGNANATVSYSSGWSTELGNGVDVTKIGEVCLQGTEIEGVASNASTACGRNKAWTNRNGLEGDWINGQDQSGAADDRYFNNVVLSEDGTTLTFTRSSQFIDDPASFFATQPCPGGCNVLTLVFNLVSGNNYELASFNQCVPFGCAVPNGGFSGSATVVPVPAAVWLFASALGLMGWIRRRANA